MSDDTYPDSPGYQDTDTSRAAASAIKPGATTIRAEVARLFEARSALTADECAERLDMSILTIRPRVTELVKQGELVDTGQRRKNRSGRLAAVYRAPTNADRWNAAHYVGQVFFYFPVRGELPVQVRTRSEAWETHGGDVIVMVEGRSGGVSVEHLQPVHPQEPESAPQTKPARTALLLDHNPAAVIGYIEDGVVTCREGALPLADRFAIDAGFTVLESWPDGSVKRIRIVELSALTAPEAS